VTIVAKTITITNKIAQENIKQKNVIAFQKIIIDTLTCKIENKGNE